MWWVNGGPCLGPPNLCKRSAPPVLIAHTAYNAVRVPCLWTPPDQTERRYRCCVDSPKKSAVPPARGRSSSAKRTPKTAAAATTSSKHRHDIVVVRPAAVPSNPDTDQDLSRLKVIGATFQLSSQRLFRFLGHKSPTSRPARGTPFTEPLSVYP